MSDPFETLKNLDGGTGGTGGTGGPADGPLPAAEVRRRGDSLRRRRTAFRAVGAACAVALVTTGGVALGGNLTSSSQKPPVTTQGPSPSPTRTTTPPVDDDVDWVTEIPAGFPLTQGYPEDRDSDTELTGPGPKVHVLEDLAACGTELHPTTDPADRLAVRFQRPEDFRARELTTYPDEETAASVVSTIVTGLDGCKRESDGGTPESVTFTEVRHTDVGDEGYAVVQTYEYDGLPDIGLGQIQVVRVGNSVLLASTSNEGGGSQHRIDRAVAEETNQTSDVAASMCVFSREGCSGNEPVDGSTGNLPERLIVDVQDIEELTPFADSGWNRVPDRQDPTLDCQSDWLSSLGPDATVYAEYAGRDSSGQVNRRAATAVLQFGSAAQAGDARDTAARWVEKCDDRMDGVPRIVQAYPAVHQETEHGPATWRTFEYSARDLCDGFCHLSRIDGQGVAQVGDRLVLLSIVYVGEGGFGQDYLQNPMTRGIQLAAGLAAEDPQPRTSEALGPLGFDALELGMHTWEQPGSGLVDTVHTDGSCEAFRLHDYPAPAEDAVDGYATENQGVTAILAREGVSTPSGIRLGSTKDEVRAAYPDAQTGAEGWSTPVPGFRDRSYGFVFQGDRVTELSLALDAQQCFG